MKLVDLMEASPFRRKRTNINRTIGFEFEVETTISRDDIVYNDISKYLDDNNIDRYKVVDDSSLTQGFEAISPAYNSVDVALKDLRSMLKLIRETPEWFTNENTGLHINIGTWNDPSDLDLLKLLVFSNEKNILEQFMRYDNETTTPILPHLIEKLKNSNYEDIDELISSTNKYILRLQQKHRFINFQKLVYYGYLEIRGIGNKNYEYREDEIIQIIDYVLKVLAVAENPEAARQQYINKLIKLGSGIYDEIDQEKKIKGKKEEPADTILTKQEINNLKKVSSDMMFYVDSIQKINNKPTDVPNRFYVNSIELLTEKIASEDDNAITSSILKPLHKLWMFLLKNGFVSFEEIENYYEKEMKNSNSQKIKSLFGKYILA